MPLLGPPCVFCYLPQRALGAGCKVAPHVRKNEAPRLRAQTPGATTTNDRLNLPFHPAPACFCLACLLPVQVAVFLASSRGHVNAFVTRDA
jgi:hypothetical protein